MIDNKAIIDPSAKVADDVEIGPFSVIGSDVEIDSGTVIGSHVVIKGPTHIGRENHILQFSSIGEDPQDKKYHGEKSFLEIGDRNLIREFVTLNRGTELGGGVTKIGNDNLLMAYVHIAHDCIVGNDTIFSNNASLAGHVMVDDHVILGGFAGIFQFCRLAPYSFVMSGSIVIKDVLPYIRVSGTYAKPVGLNIEGLRRHGFEKETIVALKEAYKIIYRQNLTVSEAITKLNDMLSDHPEIQIYIDMLNNSKRGIVR